MKRIFSIAILLICVSYTSLQAQEVEQSDGPKFTNFSPAIFQAKYKPDAKLIDCRTAAAYAKSHLKAAQLLQETDVNLKDKLKQLEKDKNIFIYGTTVSESLALSEVLANMGFLYIYNLNGGFDDLVKLGMQLEK